MTHGRSGVISANALRRELSVRNRQIAAVFTHEQSYGASSAVLYAEEPGGTHGNFLPASYRRIVASKQWSRRLTKTYSGSAWIARPGDRVRYELDSCNSSDALLMNVFCYPRVTWRSPLCALLGVERGLAPQFGVRAALPMHRDEVDRTEVDMRLGDLLVESKLSESGFGVASRERLLRYVDVEAVVDLASLQWGVRGVAGYQVIRGALAAAHAGGRYLLLCDERRADLREQWFRALGAIRTSELRSRMVLLSWQELAATLSPTVQTFLAAKYGILSRQAVAAS